MSPVRSRAAVQVADRALEMWEIEVPALGAGEALLEIEACGMCRSDYDLYVGNLRGAGVIRYPIVAGHEIVGRIAEIGPGSSWSIHEGDRVALESTLSCGRCDLCASGAGVHCPSRFSYGFAPVTERPGLWGGYAEFVVLRPGTVLHRLREDLSPEDAVLFNPLAAGYEWACRAAGTRIGDTILIIGPGQRGLACVIAAHEAGAARIIVAGLARDMAKMAIASRFGATDTITVDQDPLVERVREITGGRMADCVIDTSPGVTQPIVDAVEAVKPTGTVLLAGLKGQATLAGLISDRITLRGVRLQGVLGASTWAHRQAVRTLNAGIHSFDALHTFTLRLDQLTFGMQALGGETTEDAPIHITVIP